MRYRLCALEEELPGLTRIGLDRLCSLLPELGFPVDGVEDRMGDPILDVDVTANRGDALSHRGLARDVAAKLRMPLKPLKHRPLDEGTPRFPVRLEADACPLYATAILELGATQVTPDEVVTLLAALGINAKHLAAVDASNELLQRYGHPTHAFDADTLQGALIVRWARDGERLLGLDGVERVLTHQDLVIADEGGPVALAGVLGGERTKVTPQTRRVLLESAYFEPRVVRRMAHRHGLHTDASHRFGRGVDPAMATVVRDLLVERLQAWAGAQLVGAWTVGALPPAPPRVALPGVFLDRMAGEAIPLEEAEAALRSLGCRVSPETSVLWVEPPTWRHDLNLPEDLAEEVLRLRGFDQLGMALPPLEGPPQPLDEGYLQRRRVAQRLAHAGFFQTVTYGFVDPDEPPLGDDVEGRLLANPLGREYSLMRGTLLRSLRAVAVANLAQGAREVRLFEIAPTYRATAQGPQETWTLGLLWAGRIGGEDPLSPVRELATEEGRSFLLGVLEDLGLPAASWKPVPVDDEGALGWMVEGPLTDLPACPDRIIPPFRPFSRFPRVERDLSLLVEMGRSYRDLVQAMEAVLRAEAGSAFQDLRCVDVFRHKSLPVGREAWLLRLRFQAPDRTLTGSEVDAWVASALAVARAHGAELRA